MIPCSRLIFSGSYAARHLLLSVLIGLFSALVVFGLWYPSPWKQIQQVGSIYLLILAVDVICGPLLTLILAAPQKTRRERWIDFSGIGILQILALLYGMHSVWMARPVALVFEVDRLALITANEIEPQALAKALPDFRKLSWTGELTHAGTRKPKNNAEMLRSVEMGLAGISIAQQPDWWLPWADVLPAMRERVKPLSELIAKRPQDASTLEAAALRSGLGVKELSYLPLVSSKTLEWVALLDADLRMVGYAPVDGF